MVSVKISTKNYSLLLSSKLKKSDIFSQLRDMDFQVTILEDGQIVCHGEATAFNCKAVIHIYFDASNDFVNSIMVHPRYEGKSAIKSYITNQQQLEVLFGIPNRSELNQQYSIPNSI